METESELCDKKDVIKLSRDRLDEAQKHMKILESERVVPIDLYSIFLADASRLSTLSLWFWLTVTVCQ